MSNASTRILYMDILCRSDIFLLIVVVFVSVYGLLLFIVVFVMKKKRERTKETENNKVGATKRQLSTGKMLQISPKTYKHTYIVYIDITKC